MAELLARPISVVVFIVALSICNMLCGLIPFPKGNMGSRIVSSSVAALCGVAVFICRFCVQQWHLPFVCLLLLALSVSGQPGSESGMVSFLVSVLAAVLAGLGTLVFSARFAEIYWIVAAVLGAVLTLYGLFAGICSEREYRKLGESS